MDNGGDQGGTGASRRPIVTASRPAQEGSAMFDDVQLGWLGGDDYERHADSADQDDDTTPESDEESGR